MREARRASKRSTIFIGESDRHGHTPLATEMRATRARCWDCGASVFRGVEGYGTSNHIHTTRILSLSDDPPVRGRDRRQRTSATSSHDLDELITEGLVIIDDVDVVEYTGRGRS